MPIFVLYRVSVDFNMHVLCVYVCVWGGGGGEMISLYLLGLGEQTFWFLTSLTLEYSLQWNV